MSNINANELKRIAVEVLRMEAEAVAALEQRVDDQFVAACQLLLECSGRVIVLALGKSGHIGNKFAATLASTGTPAFFVHPTEASHGDLGMILAQDVVIAISYSGESDEMLPVLPILKRMGCKLIAITGNPNSSLASFANVTLNTSVEQEAGQLGLAPTTSTTAALALSDALAIALSDARGFSHTDFARSHPAGRLGRRLLYYVDDLMLAGDAMPQSHEADPLRQVLIEISQKGLGMTVIVDEQQHVVGVFTDGDLRRTLDQQIDIHSCTVGELMTKNCATANSGILAIELVEIMKERKISCIPIVNEQKQLQGVIHMQHLLQARIL